MILPLLETGDSNHGSAAALVLTINHWGSNVRVPIVTKKIASLGLMNEQVTNRRIFAVSSNMGIADNHVLFTIDTNHHLAIILTVIKHY